MKDIEDVIEDYITKNISEPDLEFLYTNLIEAGYSKEQISASSFRKLMEQSSLLKNYKSQRTGSQPESGDVKGKDRSIPDIEAFELPDEY